MRRRRSPCRRFTFSIDPLHHGSRGEGSGFPGDRRCGAGTRCLPWSSSASRPRRSTWPLKILRALLDDAGYRTELVQLLDRFDTEYARNVEPKQQLIMALGDIKGDDVRVAVERFLDDVNETVRFHAVQTIFSQGDEASVPALVKMLATEESVRVKNKVAEGLMTRGWTVPAELRSSASQALQDSNGFSVGSDGKLRKGAGYS